MTPTQSYQITFRPLDVPADGVGGIDQNVDDWNSSYNILFGASLSHIAKRVYGELYNPDLLDSVNLIDKMIGEIANIYHNLGDSTYDDCINISLLGQYTVTQTDLKLRNTDPNKIRPTNLYTTILKTSSMTNLLQSPIYNKYEADLSKLNDPYKSGRMSWFEMLSMLIPEIKPKPDDSGVPPPLIYYVFDFATGIYELPRTPMSRAGGPIADYQKPPANTQDKYTYYELFRIMDFIQQFFVTGDIDFQKSPEIFASRIGEWDKYVTDLSSKKIINLPRTIGVEWPEFIFLYRILVTTAVNQIKSTIMNCVKNMLKKFADDFAPLPSVGPGPPIFSPMRQHIRTSKSQDLASFHKMYYYGITDEHLTNLLVPSYPDPNIYNSPGSKIQARQKRNNKFDGE